MIVVPHTFKASDLVGGHLALDLANTVTARDTTPRDWFADFAAACAWARLTGAFGAPALSQLSRLADSDPRGAAAALRRLRDLREALHDCSVARVAGSRSLPIATARIESHWKAATSAATLALDGLLRPRWTVASSGLDLLRHVIAWHAVAFFGGDLQARTRVCDGHDCGWLFVDTSKSGRRRWCDMQTCGNVAKARRHQYRISVATATRKARADR